MSWVSMLPAAAALIFAPLALGIVNRVKALFAGRRGVPLAQPYFDLFKLLRKGAVYSDTTTWIFRAGPIAGLAAVLIALAVTPLGGLPALLPFPGDLVLFAYALGLMRFLTVMAALDTGSSFEGMGGSREAQFSTLAEPALFLGLAALAHLTGAISLSAMSAAVTGEIWAVDGIALGLIGSAFFIVALAENSRIPVDDPNTHLELTMIHEVMVLDHSGPDFAFIQYAAALKFWILGALLMGTLAPFKPANPWLALAAGLGGMAALAVMVGIVESCMARLRLARVAKLLVGAGALAALALALVLR